MVRWDEAPLVEDTLSWDQAPLVDELDGGNQPFKRTVGVALRENLIDPLTELPKNLEVGFLGLGASSLYAIKRRAVQLAGSGVFPDESLKSQFEAVSSSKTMPKIDPSKPGGIIGQLQEGNQRISSVEEALTPKKDIPLPGALTSEAVGITSRLPDIGGRLLQSKQAKLLLEQEKEDMGTVGWKQTPLKKAFRSTVQGGVPSMAAAIGISAATGDPLIGLALLSESSGGQAFQEQLEKGSDLFKAGIIGDLNAAAEAGGEMLVFPKIVQGITKGVPLREAISTILENAGQEGATGFVQSFVSTYGEETTAGKSKKEALKKAFYAGLSAIPEDAVVGGLSAAGPSALGVGVDYLNQRTAKTEETSWDQAPLVEETPEATPVEETPVEETPVTPPPTTDEVRDRVRNIMAAGGMATDVNRQIEDADTSIRNQREQVGSLFNNLQESLKGTPEGQMLKNLQESGAAPEVITKEYTEEAFQRSMDLMRKKQLDAMKAGETEKGEQNAIEEQVPAPDNANVSQSRGAEETTGIRPQTGGTEGSTGVPVGGQEGGEIPGQVIEDPRPFEKYRAAIPNATEKEIIDMALEDGLEIPMYVLNKYRGEDWARSLIEDKRIKAASLGKGQTNEVQQEKGRVSEVTPPAVETPGAGSTAAPNLTQVQENENASDTVRLGVSSRQSKDATAIKNGSSVTFVPNPKGQKRGLIAVSGIVQEQVKGSSGGIGYNVITPENGTVRLWLEDYDLSDLMEPEPIQPIKAGKPAEKIKDREPTVIGGLTWNDVQIAQKGGGTSRPVGKTTASEPLQQKGAVRSEPAAPVQKQPWEMTLDELYAYKDKLSTEKEYYQRTKAEAGRLAAVSDLAGWKHDEKVAQSDVGKKMIAMLEESLRTGTAEAKGHENQIRNAIKDEKPVPAEVLAEYPDLVKATDKKDFSSPSSEKGTVPASEQAAPIQTDYVKLKDDVKDILSKQSGNKEVLTGKLTEALIKNRGHGQEFVYNNFGKALDELADEGYVNAIKTAGRPTRYTTKYRKDLPDFSSPSSEAGSAKAGPALSEAPTEKSPRSLQDNPDVEKYGIYTANIKGRGVMYAVRENMDNPRGGGDSLFVTKQKADEYVEQVKERDAANEKYRQEQKAVDDAKEAKKKEQEAVLAEKRSKSPIVIDEDALKSMPQLQAGRAKVALARKYRFSAESGLGVATLREAIESGHYVGKEQREDPAVEYNRVKFNRMNHEQQKAYEERLKDKKTVYRIYDKDGNGIAVPKIVFDVISINESLASKDVDQLAADKAAALAAGQGGDALAPKNPSEITVSRMVYDLKPLETTGNRDPKYLYDGKNLFYVKDINNIPEHRNPAGEVVTPAHKVFWVERVKSDGTGRTKSQVKKTSLDKGLQEAVPNDAKTENTPAPIEDFGIKIGDTVRISKKPSTGHLEPAAGKVGKITDTHVVRGRVSSWAVDVDGKEFIVDSDKDMMKSKATVEKAKVGKGGEKTTEKKAEPQKTNWREGYAQAGDMFRKADILEAISDTGNTTVQELRDVMDRAKDLDEGLRSRIYWNIAQNPVAKKDGALAEEALRLREEIMAPKGTIEITLPRETPKPKGTKKKVKSGDAEITVEVFGNGFGLSDGNLMHIAPDGGVAQIVPNRYDLTAKESIRLMQRLEEKGIKGNVSKEDAVKQITDLKAKEAAEGNENALDRDIYQFLTALAQSEPELGEQFLPYKKFEVTYVSDGITKHRKAKSLEEMKTEIGKRLKKFVSGFPEFKKSPVFIFDKDGLLSFSRGGSTVRFFPSHFGLKDEISEGEPIFKEGDTTPVDLESFGIDSNLTPAERKAFLGVNENKTYPTPATTGKDIKEMVNADRTDEEVRKSWDKQRKWEDSQVQYRAALDMLDQGTPKNITTAAKEGKKAGRTKDGVLRAILQATKDTNMTVKETADLVDAAWGEDTPAGGENTVFTAEKKDASVKRQKDKAAAARKARGKGGPSGQAQIFTKEDYQDLINILGYYAEKGIRSAAGNSVRTIKGFTEKAVEVFGDGILPHVDAIWQQVKTTLKIPDEPTPTPPTTTPPAPVRPSSKPTTPTPTPPVETPPTSPVETPATETPAPDAEPAYSLKNEETNKNRAKFGLPEHEKTPVIHFEAVLQNARDILEKDPAAIEKVLGAFRNNPSKGLTTAEEALLLKHIVDINNKADVLAMQKLEALSKRNADVVRALDAALKELAEQEHEATDYVYYGIKDAARALGFRRMFVSQQYSLLRMMHNYAAKSGVPVDDKTKAWIEDLSRKLNDALKEVDRLTALEDDYKRKLVEAEARKQVAEEVKKSRNTGPVDRVERKSRYGGRNVVISRERMEANSRFLRDFFAGKTLNTGLNPQALQALIENGIFHLEAVSRELGAMAKKSPTYLKDVYTKWVKRMQDTAGDGFLPHAQVVWDTMNQQQLAEEKTELLDELQDVVEGNSDADIDLDQRDADIGNLIMAIDKNHIASGITDLNKLVDADYAAIHDILPEMTWIDVLQARSGYGKFRALNQDALSKETRRLHKEGIQASKLFDIYRRLKAKVTGTQREAPSKTEREYLQLINEAKKRYGIDTADRETLIKSALSAAKTRKRNAIIDLETQIMSRTKLIKEKAVLKPDAELNQLIQQYDTLKKEFDAIFADPQADAEAKVAKALVSAEKSLAYWTDLLKRKSTEVKAKLAGPTSDELDSIRRRRKQVRKEVIKLRNAAKPRMSVEDRILKRIESRRARYLNRMASQDFAPKVKPLPVLSDKLVQAMAKVERTKREFDEKAYDALMKSRHWVQKIGLGFLDIGNIIKTGQLGGEASFIGRQLATTAPFDPIGYAKSVEIALKCYADPEFAKKIESETESDPYYHAAKKWAGLEFSEAGIPGKNEFYSTKFWESIPGLRQLYIRSGAAANTPLNWRKLDMWKNLSRDRVNAGELSPDFYKAPTESDLKIMRRDAAWINDMSGRSGISKINAIRQAFTVLNYVGLAPRYTLSQIKLVGSLYGITRAIAPSMEIYRGTDGKNHIRWDGKIDRIMLNRAVKAFIRAMSFSVAVAAMAFFANPDDNKYIFDPKSADFMKVRIGNERYNLTAGLNRVIRFIWQVSFAEQRDASGRVSEADRGFLIKQFLYSKEAPIIRFAANLITGKDFAGQDISKGKAVWDAFTMLFLNDAIDATKNSGVLAGAMALGAGFVGIGVQSYPETANTSLKVAQDDLAQKTFGKNWMDLSDIQQDRLNSSSTVLKDLTLKKKQERDLEPYEYKQPASEFDAGQRIFKSLSKENQDILLNYGIKTISIGHGIGKEGFRLNDARFKAYEEEITKVLSGKDFRGLREEAIKKRIDTAREIARGRVLRKIRQGQL